MLTSNQIDLNCSGIQTMKGEMLKYLETRFDDIEESELLLVSDPRFKENFLKKLKG